MMSEGPKCECPLAGFCKRHGVEKTPLLHRKCQTDPVFWEAWEKGKGPLQLKQPAATAKTIRKPPPKGGPGTELKRELASRGYSTTSGCGCANKANKMDNWGAAKCREKIEEITDWLVEAAKKHSWLTKIAMVTPVVGDIGRIEIRKMVLRAIEAAEARSQEVAE